MEVVRSFLLVKMVPFLQMTKLRLRNFLNYLKSSVRCYRFFFGRKVPYSFFISFSERVADKKGLSASKATNLKFVSPKASSALDSSDFTSTFRASSSIFFSLVALYWISSLATLFSDSVSWSWNWSSWNAFDPRTYCLCAEVRSSLSCSTRRPLI